jgi:uncharacterized protein (TIGR02145 family)
LLNGGDILHLTSITTGVNNVAAEQQSKLRIYPNPMSDYSTMQFSPLEAGEAKISVYDISGKILAQHQMYLEKANQEFKLSGFQRGRYLLVIRGSSYQFTAKLLSVSNSGGSINIEKTRSIKSSEEKELKLVTRNISGTVDMDYSPGDRLKFTGKSGKYSTVIMDIPESDNDLTFDFISCTDGDNNNYPVIEIGTQLWMEENLKTTRYNDGTNIPLVTDDSSWPQLTSPGYCWFNNNETYKPIYGALYNYYVIDRTSNGNKSVCPTGWHVPTDEQWTTLTSYLGGDDVAGNKLKESGTAHWSRPNSGATNESGFTALPGGYRATAILNEYGEFMVITTGGCWWSSAEYETSSSWNRGLHVGISGVARLICLKQYGFSIRCIKGEEQALPVLTTNAVSSISPTSAISGGQVTNEGGSTVTSRGICWSTSIDPTIENNKTVDGSGIGNFSSTLSSLSAGTSYYVRAYATNIAGTTYGNQIKFNTKIADIEGNTYNTVSIGSQIWMAENLKTTKYRNGDLIGTTTPATKNISAESSPKYQWAYGGNESNAEIYGRLYTWFAANDNRKICPVGWHLPSDIEWTNLINPLAELSVVGGYLKEEGTSHWLSPNTGATNQSGFTALPGGDRSLTGTFGYLGTDGTWWSSTEFNTNNAMYFCLKYNLSSVNRADFDKPNGFSVRCIKGEIALPTVTSFLTRTTTQTTVICTSNISNDGGSQIISRGACWSTAHNPTIIDNKTNDGTGTGDYTSTITGLTIGTTYYVRAYATNSLGTGYGDEKIVII